jgi:hypothetical protein
MSASALALGRLGEGELRRVDGGAYAGDESGRLDLHLLLAGHGLGRGLVRGGLGRDGELRRLGVGAGEGELLGLGLELGLECGLSRLGRGERGRGVVGRLRGLGRGEGALGGVQGLGGLLGAGNRHKGDARENGQKGKLLHRVCT